tara:strand:+ start:2045 stop:2257 length:213 start_codon:yes stop_codon:yes gene_type:complete
MSIDNPNNDLEKEIKRLNKEVKEKEEQLAEQSLEMYRKEHPGGHNPFAILYIIILVLMVLFFIYMNIFGL